jgi:hypothetical protein
VGDVAIVVLTFDGYKDVWDTFFECLKKHWSACPFKVYLVNNNLKPDYLGVSVLNTGDEKSWSNRVRKALELIPEEIILVLLEDYFFHIDVDNKEIKKVVSYFIDNQLDYLRLNPIPYEYKRKTKGIYPLDTRFLYGVNLQAALWRKAYLKELLFKDDFSAWEFEARQKLDSPTRIVGKCATVNYACLPYLNGVIQGKWYPNTIKELTKQNINIDVSRRGIIPNNKLFIMDAQNWLLHNIPIGIIKKIKPFIKKMGFEFVTK